MSGYIGPIPVPQGIQNKESFTATAAQTTFNTNGYTDGAFISVYLNGVRLVNGTDYTATNGSDVVLASAANTGDVLDFETFNSFSLVSQTFDNLTTKNPTHEDTDGGRESALSFQGEQSGGEISTLAAIQASHDGTADDEKGDLIFRTNDGNDGASPTERMRIDSAGEITLTGNIANTSGDFTLDVDGDIVLDANGAQLRFKDDGTEIGVISNSSNDLQIVSSVSDADMIFRGNDGGTPFNALTLDMSDAGTAIFNNKVGIGTSSPSEQINLVGSGGTSKIRFDGDSSNLQNNFIGITGYDDLIIASDEANSASASTIQFRVDATERMRIDSDGKTTLTNTSAGASTTPLVLHNASSNANTDVKMLLAPCTTAADRPVILAATNDGSNVCHFTISTPNGGTPVERIRFQGNGQIDIGTTTNVFSNTSTNGTNLFNNGSHNISSTGTMNFFLNRNGAGEIVRFHNLTSAVGSISVASSSTAYNTSSDYRLKENIVDLTDGISKVKELQPRRFNWIADDTNTPIDGFIAHEAATVVPESVEGKKDGVEVWNEGEEIPDGFDVGDNKLDSGGNTIPLMQGIDQAKLVPLLTAALQEAIAKIETLESENTAIKDRLDALEAE